MQAGKLAKVILMSAKPSTPPLFKALSTEYRNRLNFGEIKSSQKELVEKLKVENFPTVLVIPKEDGAEPVVYEGWFGCHTALHVDELMAPVNRCYEVRGIE